MQVRGPSMHHWQAEQSGIHRGWSSFLKPSPELVPPLELKCMIQELASAEWVSYCSQLQSLNLHFSVWRKLTGDVTTPDSVQRAGQHSVEEAAFPMATRKLPGR